MYIEFLLEKGFEWYKDYLVKDYDWYSVYIDPDELDDNSSNIIKLYIHFIESEIITKAREEIYSEFIDELSEEPYGFVFDPVDKEKSIFDWCNLIYYCPRSEFIDVINNIDNMMKEYVSDLEELAKELLNKYNIDINIGKVSKTNSL